jgi:hypothetical protein
LASTPNDIAKLGGLYFGINPNYLQSIAESKANTSIGIILVSFSFLFQLVIHVFKNKLSLLHFNPSKRNITISIIGLFCFTSGIYLLHSKLVDNTIFSTHKEMAYLSLKKQYDYNESHSKTQNEKVILGEGQVNVIRNYIDELAFKKKPGESGAEYFARFYKYLGHDFADQINFIESGVK